MKTMNFVFKMMDFDKSWRTAAHWDGADVLRVAEVLRAGRVHVCGVGGRGGAAVPHCE